MKTLSRYKEIESFLFSQLPMFQRVGPKAFKKNLDNILFLDDYLVNPHKSFKSIHIAGTNGKGSTSFMVASMLKFLGFKVGLYTSPHYKDYRERIRVDKEMINKTYVKKFVNRLIQDGIFESDMKPSFFEISVAMAFDYFKFCEVDYAVIETGLGGRLDSTNIIHPEVSLITNIGFDHMNFLGDTLELIAGEKAGIIKKGTPVLIGKTQEETRDVFTKVAKEKEADIQFADQLARNKCVEDWLTDMPDYQRENAYLAYYGVAEMGLDVQSLKKMALPNEMAEWGFVGRFQKLGRDPLIIFDSAHNREGIMALLSELRKTDFDKLHIVLATVGDKNLDKVLELYPEEATYYFSNARIPRALDRFDLQNQAERFGLKGKVYVSVRRAFNAAVKKAQPRDLVLVTGSIFTVAEMV